MIYMCLAIPGRVVSVAGRTGIVEIMGVTREVSFELLRDISVGEYVMVHAGCAIEKVNEEEALKTMELFKELQDIVKD